MHTLYTTGQLYRPDNQNFRNQRAWHPRVYENMKHDPTWYSGYNDCNFNQLVGQMGLVCKFVITVVSNIVDMWVMEVPWSWGSFDTTVSRLWRDAR